MIKGKAVKETGCYKKEKVKRNEMSQAASRLAWDMEEKVNDLCTPSLTAVSAISESRLPVPASTYSSPQVVQICAGISRITMVVSPLVSVTVVVPGSVSPYWQMTHFMSVSSWSSYPVPTYRWLARTQLSRSLVACLCFLRRPHGWGVRYTSPAAISLKTGMRVGSLRSLHHAARCALRTHQK